MLGGKKKLVLRILMLHWYFTANMSECNMFFLFPCWAVGSFKRKQTNVPESTRIHFTLVARIQFLSSLTAHLLKLRILVLHEGIEDVDLPCCSKQTLNVHPKPTHAEKHVSKMLNFPCRRTLLCTTSFFPGGSVHLLKISILQKSSRQ